GCPRGDKGSDNVTFIAAAIATGRCTVRPESPVIRIEAGPNDQVAAVFVGRADGSLERIVSRHVVLACGAVETPRLLLASEGLGNESGEVGQNFMDTLFVTVGALHGEPQHGRRGLPSDAITWDFNAPDAIPGVIGGCRFYNAASGAERVYENYSSWDWFVATHVFGSCRMGDNPASAVVDAFGRSHRWRNLWIADASVFPSSGGGEAPSLTIHALALRTAERIA